MSVRVGLTISAIDIIDLPGGNGLTGVFVSEECAWLTFQSLIECPCMATFPPLAVSLGSGAVSMLHQL